MTSRSINHDAGQESLLRSAGAGDEEALRELLSMHRDRLKRMVRCRLDPRLLSRLDESDVVQEAWLDASRRMQEFLHDPRIPFYAWLRHLTQLKLVELHRHHLGAEMRDARREISIDRGRLPNANSDALAVQLLGTATSPTEAAAKAEMRRMLQKALDEMDAIDREVLAMRHFEQLSTQETAEILGLSKAGAGSRYLRALSRLREILSQRLGFDESLL